ncbi:antitoxin [Diplocloster agilis]|uniref:antitoxin n=1 Tax=Diplocloster agilis TaxID=2850323 RepID=UPI000820F07B|nr:MULTISPECIES: antitoxin [Lachnospiraceae]MBU9744664.1 antitoxin [Diplocloster agilis]MCU6734553.1 antitoxin [Suonthocola fibrivorans]SCJ44419.1 Uncharacterised protein [uncultured Clostridium sp.]
MADILKVTSPMISKNVIQPNKAAQDPSIPFDLQEISHIVKNPNSSELLGQHNIFQKEAGAATLMNLIKDPDVTVNYLKNIYLLEEIINLLPVNNKTVTQEIRQLFQSLLIGPEAIVDELKKQEYSSTLFQGPLFEFLRNLYEEKPGIKSEIAELLKAVNGEVSRQDVLDSVGNSLEYLAEQLKPSQNLSGKLSELAAAFRRQDAPLDFQQLKTQVLAIVKELENSILYTPQVARVIPNMIYNLSRFQDNPSYLQEALLNVLVHVSGRENKDLLKTLVREYLSDAYRGTQQRRSKVMDILADIISKQDRETQMSSLNGEKIEKIITSLLSSPCNYTPLLHFVIPVDYEGMKSFAELWIDPDDRDEPKEREDEGRHIHMLITFDIQGIGQMEAEFMVIDGRIRFQLFCPERYTQVFQSLAPEFRDIAQEKGYLMTDVRVEKLEKVRSLMDVFKTLPYKRTGVDVKI